MRGFTIGALAKATGTSTPTIRYYEEIGLLPPANRTASGQRNYDESDVGRLTFIKQCRDFGFSIEQVRVLLDLSVSSERDCAETRDIAQAHLDEVRTKMVELRALEKRLQGFVMRCNDACAGGPGSDCVIFKDMANPPTKGCCG
ncbi:MerR family transcriptional regulator [Rhizobium ruizarguesonis]|uniref:MerR family transcriptional regulator n=1 Tax=Rhizobium ruizarguesonis TaxID=2081791 RepID=A0AAE4YZ54_9HYPH|nr:MerR family transcriptional regulator [Rhizobium ruizarguesonis]QIJ43233.1 helix-turn-helix domain-containing protein [Rhizobium leguminosarum]NEI08047.1 MerR family transcriptional regulator [Rhizobium ruizarguesonis]NEI29494.1 MerR family transcriptional regulator [Rhizobium ruizarguesonis]NEI52893.1 MerR family transcriptional regulator [Rhizobium ruizarguesonis]